MSLVAAVCTQCGAKIEVDNTKEAGICTHCGTAFITEKAINNYNITNNVTNNIKIGNINIKAPDKSFNIVAGVLTEYNGKDAVVTIPDSVVEIGGKEKLKNFDGRPVMMLVGAFEETNVTKVIIPNTVEEIGAQAFGMCKKLKKIIIPDSVKKIGADAFYDSAIEEVIIPESVEELGSGVFKLCENFKKIYLPSSLKKIGYQCFYYCKNLKEVHIQSLESWSEVEYFKGGYDRICDGLTPFLY